MATKTKTRSSIASTIVMTNRFEQRILECFYCVVATHSKSQRSQAASQVVITPSFAATFPVPILSPAPIPSSSFTLHLSEPRMSQCRPCVCHRCCGFHSLPPEPGKFGSIFGVRGCGRRQEVERWGGTHRDRASDQDGALGSNVRPGAVGHICLQHVLSTPHFRVNPRRGSTRLPEKTGTRAENRGGFVLRFYVGTTQWFSVVEWQGRDGRGRGIKQ